MINKKGYLPNIMELRLERVNYCSDENRKKDGSAMFLEKIHLYTAGLIKISNSESYIFTTEDALKLMLHINTFENYKFDINNKYCSCAYKLISNAIKDFEDVRDVFSFSTNEDGKLRIKCLSSKVEFPTETIQIDAIKEYMKYNILKPKIYSSSMKSEVKEYIPLRNVLFKYTIKDMLDELINGVEGIDVQKGEVILSDEILDKYNKMYRVLRKRDITNSIRDLSINIKFDEFSERSEIYIEEGNITIASQDLNLDDWLNANIYSYDIWKCALCLMEIVMIQYYNKKSKSKDVDNSEPDMFFGLDEIGRENLLNMLEP